MLTKLVEYIKPGHNGFSVYNGLTQLITPQGNCKAYIWDYLKVKILQNHKLDNIYICFRGSVYDTLDLTNSIERINKLEEILGFDKTTECLFDPSIYGHFVSKPADPRWFSCVELFSLYLCAIRYANTQDKDGHNYFVENPRPLIDHFLALNKDIKVNWKDVCHESGVCKFYWK